MSHNEHWLNRESGQVECECCCSHALDYERWRKEKRELEQEVQMLRAKIGELNPAEIPITRPASLAVNQLYYHQKDGGCKHDSRCGKICYNCVDELAEKYQTALSAMGKAVTDEEREKWYKIGFEDCRSQALYVVDEHEGFSSRIGLIEPTLTELSRSAISQAKEGEHER